MRFLWGVLFTLALLILGIVIIAETGRINFRADQEPSALESRLAMSALDASADRHAPARTNPLPPTDETILAGARLYRENCAGCHGDPENRETVFGSSFYPPAPQFMIDKPDMPDNQNFYIIRHGIRWTGMAAWKDLLNETQTWQLVTFLSHMDKLSPTVRQEFKKPAVPLP
jgi:mono/diheme cytochrome c family protein